jgi:hypothetical protein
MEPGPGCVNITRILLRGGCGFHFRPVYASSCQIMFVCVSLCLFLPGFVTFCQFSRTFCEGWSQVVRNAFAPCSQHVRNSFANASQNAKRWVKQGATKGRRRVKQGAKNTAGGWGNRRQFPASFTDTKLSNS